MRLPVPTANRPDGVERITVPVSFCLDAPTLAQALCLSEEFKADDDTVYTRTDIHLMIRDIVKVYGGLVSAEYDELARFKASDIDTRLTSALRWVNETYRFTETKKRKT